MNEKILFVDDDPSLLSAIARTLRKQFQLETALGAEIGLEMLASAGPYAVVVADRQMPQIDGIEFLRQARLKSPDTVRIMLTGNAELTSTIEVVNHGGIFRFLTKPCPAEALAKALEDGLVQYRLVMAERDLLERTLQGSVQMLMELLAIVDSRSFGRAQELRLRAGPLARVLAADRPWEIELAALLCHIGSVTVPPLVTGKELDGEPLTAIEREMVVSASVVAQRLLVKIPRLENVAEIVLFQGKHFDGGGMPSDRPGGDQIPLGSRIILAINDCLQLEAHGLSTADAIQRMKTRAGRYDPEVLAAMGALQGRVIENRGARLRTAKVSARGLAVGQILRSNVLTTDGTLLLTAGQTITQTTLEKIRNFLALAGIQEPITVDVPDLAFDLSMHQAIPRTS